MKATITYKCPNCGGGLTFDPKKQKYACEFCLSEFTQEQLEAIKPDAASDQNVSSEEAQTGFAAGETQAIDKGFFSAAGAAPTPGNTAGQAATSSGSPAGQAVLYTCPSCGAQIVTDVTTAATYCYYCHNPVILSGKLSGEYHPDYVIPFAIDKEKAVTIFNSWMKKKRYVPKAFYSEDQIEKLSGVYFPYLMYSCKVDGRLDASANRLRVWVAGNYQYTETQTYDVGRKGTMDISHVTRNALKKANRQLVEGVLPYDMKGLQPFSMGYLSGFVAERRDMEANEFSDEVKNEVRQFAEDSLKSSIGTYDRVSVKQSDTRFDNERWEYALLPVWALTYKDPKKEEIYYFTVNGQTGKVCGKLPVDKGRLMILFAEIFFPVLFAMLLLGYFI